MEIIPKSIHREAGTRREQVKKQMEEQNLQQAIESWLNKIKDLVNAE